MDIPDNALLQLIEHNNTYGGRAVFTCMWGHKLSGSQSITCEGDGRWNGSVPTCLGKTIACFENFKSILFLNNHFFRHISLFD